MSDRPYLAPAPVISAGNMSGNLTSLPTILKQKSMANYSASWAGTTPVGTLAVQASNDFAIDPAGNVLVAGTWNTLTLNYQGTPVQSIPVTGNTGSAMIDIDAISSYAIRLIYTFASGTGTINALIVCKVQ